MRLKSNNEEGAPSPPLARPSIENRREILVRCAAELFEEKGYEGTSMQDVADRVGLTKPALYHYVSGKEELLYAIHDAFVSELFERTEEFFSSTDDPLVKLRFVADEIVRTVAKYKPYVTVSFQEMRSLADENYKQIDAKRDAYEAIVEGCVQDAVDKGLIQPEIDPRLITLFLFGACNWTYQWYRADGPLTPEEIGDTFFDLFLSGAARR